MTMQSDGRKSGEGSGDRDSFLRNPVRCSPGTLECSGTSESNRDEPVRRKADIKIGFFKAMAQSIRANREEARQEIVERVFYIPCPCTWHVKVVDFHNIFRHICGVRAIVTHAGHEMFCRSANGNDLQSSALERATSDSDLICDDQKARLQMPLTTEWGWPEVSRAGMEDQIGQVVGQVADMQVCEIYLFS